MKAWYGSWVKPTITPLSLIAVGNVPAFKDSNLAGKSRTNPFPLLQRLKPWAMPAKSPYLPTTLPQLLMPTKLTPGPSYFVEPILTAAERIFPLLLRRIPFPLLSYPRLTPLSLRDVRALAPAGKLNEPFAQRMKAVFLIFDALPTTVPKSFTPKGKSCAVGEVSMVGKKAKLQEAIFCACVVVVASMNAADNTIIRGNG